MMRCWTSANAATYRLPATRLSGCKTSAPSQAAVDRSDPQEVLVSKEACLQFYSVSLGLRLPPSGSGCLSPEGEGLQPAISVQSFVPCAGLAVSYTKVNDNSKKMQVKCSSKLSRSSETRTVCCHCQKDPKGRRHLIQCILDEVLKQKKDFGLK